MFHEEHSNHAEMHRALFSNLSNLYIFHAFMSFVRSLIGIFVPVYLFSLGFSLKEIIFYGVGGSLIFILFVPISIFFINKFGFKWTLFLSIPIYLIQLYMIKLIPENYIYYHLCWFTYGCFMAFFWPTIHTEIATLTTKKNRTSQIGTLQIITVLLAAVAPLIGGFILEYSSYDILFFLCLFLLLIGILPLLISKDLAVKKYPFRFKDYLRLYTKKEVFETRKAFMAEGAQNILIIFLWSIILFIILENNFFTLGAITTAVTFLSVCIVGYFKSYFDKHKKKQALEKITYALSSNWFLRALGTIFFPLLYISETLFKIFNSIFQMLFQSIFYSNVSHKEYFDYIIGREFYLHTFRIILSTFIILFLIIFGESFKTFSILIFLGVIVPVFLSTIPEKI